MPKDSRALTRAARARMAASGESYTQARAALTATVHLDRDTPPDSVVTALMFAELMAAGRRAAISAPAGTAAAAAAVRSAITPLWPQVVPEAARDVLTACAGLAVSLGITALPDGTDSTTAADMLDLAAAHAGGGGVPLVAGGLAPHAAYASSAAFDRDEDAAVLTAVCLLLALAHPGGELADGDDGWEGGCPECGGSEPGGSYGCACFDPGTCSECGAASAGCDCWV